MLTPWNTGLRIQPVFQLVEYNQAWLLTVVQKCAEHGDQIIRGHALDRRSGDAIRLTKRHHHIQQSGCWVDLKPERCVQEGTLPGLALLLGELTELRRQSRFPQPPDARQHERADFSTRQLLIYLAHQLWAR